MNGERFIGGFLSGFLSRGPFGARVGYGLYFTTKRVIGVDPGSHGGSELSGSMAGYVEGQLMPALSDEDNAKIIAELDRVKDFDLSIDDIKEIEVKNAGSRGIGFGRIKITPLEGAPRTVQVRSRIAYDRLVRLAGRFAPQLLKTKPFLSL